MSSVLYRPRHEPDPFSDRFEVGVAMKIIAHRGASQERPENTLSAFERAVEIGVDAIEMDLLQTRDKRLVVRHDDLIEKDGTRYYIRDLTFDELKTIDVGKGERIPSLESVVETIRNRCPLILELKSEGLVNLLTGFLQKKKWDQQIHVTSFLPLEISQCAKAFPEIERSITLSALPTHYQTLLQDCQTKQLSLHRGFLREDLVRRLKREGITVRVYTVNWPKEAALFESWGVDAIFTDDPAAMQLLRTR